LNGEKKLELAQTPPVDEDSGVPKLFRDAEKDYI